MRFLDKYYISSTFKSITANNDARGGFVPLATTSDQVKFLRGDGTWQPTITELGQIPALSSSWNSVYTTTNANSSTWNNSTILNILSVIWNAAAEELFTFYSPESGINDYFFLEDNNNVFIASSKLQNIDLWNTAYTNLVSNSAAYLSGVDISLLAAASSNWNSTYTTVSSFSGSWNSVYSTFNANSAKYESVYTSFNANSASYATESLAIAYSIAL